jgi:hypothetical protein
MMLTNRDLAHAFGVSLTQIKRWAVIVLGRDPEADQSGGVRREYTLDDAFLIYLFGEVLVRRFRFGLKEAKAHMDQIIPQLKVEKLLISNFDMNVGTMQFIPTELQLRVQNRFNQGDIKSQWPFVNIYIFPMDNQYMIEWGIFSNVGDADINSKENVEIDTIRKSFPERFNLPFYLKGSQHIISYWAYLEIFMDLIRKEMEY